MAPRAPRMTRAKTAVLEIEPRTDAIDDVIMDEREKTAGDAADILAELRSIATSDSHIKIYKLPKNGGGWEYIKKLMPPFNMDALLDDLQDEWGGGNYMVRVLADGKIVAGKQIAIAGPPKVPGLADTGRSQSDTLMPMLIRQMETSKSDSMNMMTMMMQANQQASQNNMQMMMGMITAILPVIAGGKTDPMQIVQAMAALNADKPQQAPMTEMIQNMVAMKELLGDGGSSGGDDSFLGGAAKALLPMLAKGMEGAANRQPGPMNTMLANHPDPIRSLQPSAPISMPPMMRSNPIPPMPPVLFGTSPPASVSPPVADGNRIVALIGEDVLYFAKRGHDPATAAGMILDVIDSADIPENEILELVVSFQSSQDWIADLASQGVDLSVHRQWAEQLLEELVKQYAEDQGQDDHPEGEGGG